MNSYDDDSSSKKIQKIIEDDDDVIFLDSSSSSTLTTTISASSSGTTNSSRRKNVKPKSFPTELEPIKPLLGNVKKFYQKCTDQNLSKEDKLKEMFTFMQWYGKVDKSPITLSETNDKSEMIGSKSRKSFLDHEINKRKFIIKPTKSLPTKQTKKVISESEPEEDEYFLEDFSNDSYSSNEDDDDDDWIGDNYLKRNSRYKSRNPKKKKVSTISKISHHHHHHDRSSCSSFDSFLNTSAGISMIDNSGSSCSSDGETENESLRPRTDGKLLLTKTDEKFNNYFQKVKSKLKSTTSDSEINLGPSGINTSGEREEDEEVPLSCRIDPVDQMEAGTSGNNKIRIEAEEENDDDDDVILLETTKTRTDQSFPQQQPTAPSIIDQSRPVASSIANYVEIDYEITAKVKSKVMKNKKISEKKSRKKSKNKNETDSELEDSDEEYSDGDEDFDPDRPFPGTKEYYDWIYRKRLRKINRRKEIKRSSMVEVEIEDGDKRETAQHRKCQARKCLKQLTKRTDLDPAQKKQKLRYYRRIIDETESNYERRMREVARFQRNQQRNLARFDPSIIVPSIESDDDPSDLDWGPSQLQQHYFSDEQLKEQRKKLKQFRKQLISNETPEQRERRLKLIRQLARKQYKQLDKEQRKLFLEQMRKKYEERRKKRMENEQNCADKTGDLQTISPENRSVIVDGPKSCTTIVETTATEMIDFDSINDTFTNTTVNSVANLTAQFDPNWI